jgi:hypothetical protein
LIFYILNNSSTIILFKKKVDTKEAIERLLEALRQIRGDRFSYQDNGQTDKARFADELEAMGKYR